MNTKSRQNTLAVIIVFTIFAFATYFLLNNSGRGMNGNNDSAVVADRVPQEVQSAVESVTVNELDFILETYLWRDFMPVSPPDGKPLTAIARVMVTNAADFPVTVDADRIWIINGSEVWEAEFSTEERASIVAHTLEKIARNGPKWDAGTTVDVVVRLTDSETGNQYLLKAVDQQIGSTQ